MYIVRRWLRVTTRKQKPTRFHAMLQHWVRRPSPSPSWSTLVRLKCPVIDRADIAAQVMEKHLVSPALHVIECAEWSGIWRLSEWPRFICQRSVYTIHFLLLNYIELLATDSLSVDQHLKVVREITWAVAAQLKSLGVQLALRAEKLDVNIISFVSHNSFLYHK